MQERYGPRIHLSYRSCKKEISSNESLRKCATKQSIWPKMSFGTRHKTCDPSDLMGRGMLLWEEHQFCGCHMFMIVWQIYQYQQHKKCSLRIGCKIWPFNIYSSLLKRSTLHTKWFHQFIVYLAWMQGWIYATTYIFLSFYEDCK